MTVTPELDLGSLFGTTADGNAAVLTVGAVVAVAAARVVVAVLVAAVRVLAVAAVVATLLWIGYHAVEHLDAAAPSPRPVRPIVLRVSRSGRRPR
jgi:hypothetical protein